MRFGVVGVGGIGQIRVKALKNAQGCELAAIVDVDIDRARALANGNGTAVFDDFQKLLETDVEAVIISTPPQFHENMVISALESGKHVLCEKPLSNSVESARVMVEAARKHDKVLTTGFNQRYFPAIQFVKQTIDSGLIGELDHVRGFAGHTGLSEFHAPWEHDKNIIGGGALLDVGIHMIDLMRYMLGDVTNVYGAATCNVWGIDQTEDNGFALMRSPSGKIGTLHATWSEWKGYRFHIEAYGDKGMVRAYYAPMMSLLIHMDEPGGAPTRKRNFYPKVNIREKISGWQSTVVKTFQQELEDFTRLCAGQKGVIADGFSGFRAVEIANAVYRSTKENRAVQLADPF